jgi:hypothetical protein
MRIRRGLQDRFGLGYEYFEATPSEDQYQALLNKLGSDDNRQAVTVRMAAQGAPFCPDRRVGGFLGSYVPIAAWLNPLLTTGYAVEVSKSFNIQPRGCRTGSSAWWPPGCRWRRRERCRSRRREA